MVSTTVAVMEITVMRFMEPQVLGEAPNAIAGAAIVGVADTVAASAKITNYIGGLNGE